MDVMKMGEHMQYVEKNGCCLNIEEKIKLGLAISELCSDLGLKKCWFVGKITGVIKDYFLAASDSGVHYWCSSSSMIFSELPKVSEDPAVLLKLAGINNFFTGEFDQVLFAGNGPAKVIDENMGISLPPKAVSELDRLAYVVSQIKDIYAVPKGIVKYTPAEKIERNEAFCGLTKEKAFNLTNWQFARKPKDPEVESLIARGEAVYNPDCLDNVSKDFPKNSWSIQEDVTGTVATLKSHLWPGFYAFHRCNTNISGFVYIGDGIRNNNLPFMV